MLAFLKKIFGVKPAEPSPAPYKVEEPAQFPFPKPAKQEKPARAKKPAVKKPATPKKPRAKKSKE